MLGADRHIKRTILPHTVVTGMVCPICGGEGGEPSDEPPNSVCDECDRRAVSERGAEPWHGWPPGERPDPDPDDDVIQLPPDAGENPVFIDGQKCWRRYRFGGWVTWVDEHDCDSLEEFYEKHDMI
jgi:hypothetical protein